MTCCFSWLLILTLTSLFKTCSQEKAGFKEACEAYIQKLQKKKKKLSVKNKFIATLTHEMRNITTRYPYEGRMVACCRTRRS